MPRRTIHVREAEVLIFDTIPNRPDWLERVLYEEIADRGSLEPIAEPSPLRKPTSPAHPTNPAPERPTAPIDPIELRAKLYPEITISKEAYARKEEHLRQVNAQPGNSIDPPKPNNVPGVHSPEQETRLEGYFSNRPLTPNEVHKVPDLPPMRHLDTWEPIDGMP